MRKTVALLFYFFPMARLPGVVRQNMADFHSNPLGWDTVQLSLVCLPQKRKKKPHSITQHLFLLLLSRSSRRRRRRSSRRVSPRCFVKRRPRLRSCEGRRSQKGKKGIDAALLLPLPRPIFSFSSILLMYFYYRGHPLLRWQGDVGLPSTRGWGGVSRQTHTHAHIFIPQPVEQKMCMNGAAEFISLWAACV